MTSSKVSQNALKPSSEQETFDSNLQSREQMIYNDLPQKNPTFVSTDPVSDEDGAQFVKNPFLDPDTAAHWTIVYEKSQYECWHVFDPTFTWTEEEEQKLVRRLDWHVCLWAVCFSNDEDGRYLRSNTI